MTLCRLCGSGALAVRLLCRTRRRGSWSGARSRAPRLLAMSDLSRDDVAHLAALARIDLSESELDHLAGELAVILESVATVSSAPIGDVEPMSHPMPIVNVTRPDEMRPSLTPEQALAMAPEAQEQRFAVPRILTEADDGGVGTAAGPFGEDR